VWPEGQGVCSAWYPGLDVGIVFKQVRPCNSPHLSQFVRVAGGRQRYPEPVLVGPHLTHDFFFKFSLLAIRIKLNSIS
jgi:hypothetical protein